MCVYTYIHLHTRIHAHRPCSITSSIPLQFIPFRIVSVPLQTSHPIPSNLIPVHSFFRSFGLPIIRSSFLSLFHSLIILFTRHSLIIPCIHLFIHSFIHSLLSSLIISCVRSFVNSFIGSLIHFINSFIPSFLPSFIHSFIHAFIHSFIHS